MKAQAPFTREETTLRQIAGDAKFSEGWYTKIVDGEPEGPFVIPLKMFLEKFSDCNPELDEPRTAFFNQSENCVLLIPEYSHMEIITLLRSTAAQGYLYANEIIGE